MGKGAAAQTMVAARPVQSNMLSEADTIKVVSADTLKRLPVYAGDVLTLNERLARYVQFVASLERQNQANAGPLAACAREMYPFHASSLPPTPSDFHIRATHSCVLHATKHVGAPCPSHSHRVVAAHGRS